MILETFEVSQFSELTPFLIEAGLCGWLLEATRRMESGRI
jgi:hypothetical protein